MKAEGSIKLRNLTSISSELRIFKTQTIKSLGLQTVRITIIRKIIFHSYITPSIKYLKEWWPPSIFVRTYISASNFLYVFRLPGLNTKTFCMPQNECNKSQAAKLNSQGMRETMNGTGPTTSIYHEACKQFPSTSITVPA